MRIRLLLTGILATSHAGTACTPGVPMEADDGDAVFLTTDQSHYVAAYVGGTGSYRQYGFTVIAQFENRTGEPIYLARCFPTSPGPVFGVEMAGPAGGPEAAYNPIWACVGHDQQVLVERGQVRTDTLRLRGPTAFDGLTGEPYGVLDGRMRLRYSLQSCRGDGACQWPLPLGRSNAFTVEVQP